MAVFDDIHWAEPGLLDLIEHVAEWTRDAPILLVCPARPELQDARPGWGGQATATTLHLDPLSQDESNELIVGLLGRSDAPAAVTARVTEAAEGNPLFVEQMVAMLIDDDLIRPEADGWVVTGDLSNLTVPPTIAGLLQARLDRLTPEEQRVIERGAVEGRVFHWGSVTELSSDLAPGDVGQHLMALHRRDLIGPEQALFGGSEAFRFRHALIRDAAYERIPKRTRSELHERHARWLERVAGERLPEFEEVLAYHLEQAAALRSELGPLDDHGQELQTKPPPGWHRVAAGRPRAATHWRPASSSIGPSLSWIRTIRCGSISWCASALHRSMLEISSGRSPRWTRDWNGAPRRGDKGLEIRARLARLTLHSSDGTRGGGRGDSSGRRKQRSRSWRNSATTGAWRVPGRPRPGRPDVVSCLGHRDGVRACRLPRRTRRRPGRALRGGHRAVGCAGAGDGST